MTRSTILRPLCALAALALGFAASGAIAATTTIAVALDTDSNPATGCVVSTVNGPVAGIEQVFSTVITTTANGATVTRLERQVCVAGVLGAPVVYDNGGWNVGLGNGLAGSALVETSIPLALLPPGGAMKAVVAASNGTGGQDATSPFVIALAAPPAATGPVAVPLTPWLVPPIALLLVAATLWLRRRYPDQTGLLVVLALFTASGLVWAATVIRDGNAGDWSGVAPAVTDAAGDAPVGADIVAVFYQQDVANLYLRVDADIRKDAATNQPPVADAGADQTIALTASATLFGSATDDGLPNPPAALTYGWTKFSGPGTVAFANAASAVTSATFSAAGTYVLRLTASDGALSGTSDTRITVQDSPLLFLPIADRTIALGTRYQQLLVAGDGNPGNTLTYSLPTAPAGAGLSPTPLVDWTPTAAQLGSNTFTAKVTDAGGRIATTTFHVTVTHTNHPPQLAPQISVILPVGTAFSRTLQATDPDAGDTLTFALVSGPSGMTLTGASLNWPTAGRAPGDYSVSVKVTDNGGLSDTKTFTVTLTAAAPPPLARADSYDVHVGQTLTIPAAGVLANDNGFGLPLSATKATDPAKGTLDAFNADGSFTYTAPAGVPAPKTLSPTVVWRKAISETTNYTFAADLLHDGRIEWIANSFGNLDGWNAADGSHVLQFNKAITTHANVSGCAFTEDQYALGDVTGSGDIWLFMATNCDDTRTRGSSDRYTAINLTQRLPNGDVAAQWVSERLTRPHPGAYATGTSTELPNPPVTPVFTFSARNTYPTLAKLQPGGATKLLTRFLAFRTYGAYYGSPNSNVYSYAGCRSLTGLPQDEGIACKATYILDAATGAIDAVLTAPNPANEFSNPQGTATYENIPIVADLDGDGQVEIVSGGDVWKLVNGTWTLAWQLQVDSAVPGVKKSFEPLSVAVADLDGDGKAEVLFHVIGDSLKAADAGGIYIYNHDGTLRRKIRLDTFNTGLLSVADVDGDGVPEIMVTGDNILWVYRQDGSLLWAKVMKDVIDGVVPGINPAEYWLTTDAPILVYDLDLDGVPEVILQGVRRLFILNGRTGAELWSVDIESEGYGRKAGPKLIDADGDGHVDILVHAQERWNCNYGPGTGPVNCKGNAMLISGANHDWAPGPKIQNQPNFRPGAVDAAGKILYDPSVRRDFRQQVQQGTVVDSRADSTDSFTYKARDASGDSAPAQVTLRIVPPNNPPVITSTPPTAQLAVEPYPRRVYTITAYDPDPGDTVHFELVSTTHEFQRSFNAVTVDPVTGAVDVFSGPCSCNRGLTLINVAAVDSHGARAEQSFLLDINNVLVVVPDVQGMLLPAARTTLEAASLKSRVVSETFGPQPAGTVLAQDPLPGAPNIPRSTSVGLTVSKGPAPVTVPFVVGKTLTQGSSQLAALGLAVAVTPVSSTTIPAGEIMTQSPAAGTELLPVSVPPVALTVSAGGPLPAPIASILLEPGPGPLLRLDGDELQFKAVAILTDGTSADVSLTAAWSSSLTGVATVNAAGFAKAIANGATTITAALSGKSAQVTLNVASRTPADNTPPVASIAAPANGSTVTGPTQVIGTATDANFLRYELAIAPAGGTTWTLIGEGTAPVANGALGTFDPTTLVNDLYTIRLTVFDRGENQSVATTTVQLTGDRKVGSFSLSFNDLTIPMAGIPITVTRTYDSRDKAKGDFGIGWRLSLQTLRLRTNRVLGTGWVRNVAGINVSLAATDEHKVSLTMPNGHVEEFDMVVSPTANIGSLDATSVTGFVGRAGTVGTLQALVNNDLLIVGGGAEDELVDDSTLNTYDPKLWRYTAPDGLQIDIHKTEGVQKITDRNGNTVTFSAAGIIHSAGKSVSFGRDPQGRITQITDPLGHVQTYAYDGNGDLVNRTDAVGAVSRYAYNRSHGLIDITDPAGNHPARNDYDDAGRVLSTTDANGNAVTFTHNPGTSQEIVRDRLGNPTLYDYDAQGNVLAKTDALGKTTSYTYDSRNNRLTETDPMGRVASKTYDSRNNILASTDFDGNTTTTTYNLLGQPLTIKDPEGRVLTNVFDAAGRLVQSTDPEGGITKFTYDAAGNLVTRTNPLNKVTSFTYDASGNKLTETDPLGRTTTNAYDANGRVISVTDALGRTEHRTYDATGRLTGVTDRLGNTTTTTYSEVGDGQRIATRTDAAGRVHRDDYDAMANRVKVTFPDGSQEVTTFDAEGRELSRTNRDGRTTSYAYDALGRKTITTHPDGAFASTTWDAAGRKASQTDERGNTTTYAYAPNRQTVTDPLGHASVHEFDSQQRRVRFTDALARVTTFRYDSAGGLLKTTYPDLTTKTATFDAAKRKVAETDQAGRTTQFAYDAAGQLVSVTDGTGGITAYAYDTVGNRVTQTDANGHATQLSYDAMKRVTARMRPSGKQETFVYDVNGVTLAHTDFAGKTTTFVLDPVGRMTQKNLPGGGTVPFAFSASSLRTQAGGDTATYDTRSRLVQEHKATGETLAYTYDAAGNKSSLSTPQGAVSYTHDALNRLASVVDAAGTTTYGYDAVGNLATTAYPNGVTVTCAYDTLGRLVSATNSGPSGLISSYAYTLGPAGNRLQVVESGPSTAGRTVTYTYDAVYRLTREKIVEPAQADVTIDYSYDTAGNRTQMNRNGVVTTYAYDTSDRLVTETTGATIVASTYDDNGNLKSRAGGGNSAAYAYDAENRLAGVANGGGSVSFAYDADGMRIGRSAGGVVTAFLLDKAGAATSCCGKGGAQLAQVVVETTGATVVSYAYGHALIRQTRTGSGTQFFIVDGQLSTRQLTNAAGAVTDAFTFDAFGVELAHTGATPNVYRYAGEQLDANAGFYYLRARYYDQASGRLIGADPELGSVFDPMSLHRYLYAHGNPVNNRDPSGRADFTLAGLTTGQIVAGSLATGFVASVGFRATGIAKDWSSALLYGAEVSGGLLVAAFGGIWIRGAGELAHVATNGFGRALANSMLRIMVTEGGEDLAATFLRNRIIQLLVFSREARCVALKAISALVPTLIIIGVGAAGAESPGITVLDASNAEPLAMQAERVIDSVSVGFGCQ